MQATPSKTVELVLVGGGHSHALALRNFAMNPLPGVSITLISDRSVTPYSGMLPGFLAGKYTYDDCHIDLRKLMRAVDGQFWVDTVTGLDADHQWIQCAHHPKLRYDWLSIDTGSTPVLPDIPGATEYGVPVKPWHPFLKNWAVWTDRLTQSPQPVSLVIVGGGAGGVELALNADAKFSRLLKPHSVPWTIHLVHRGDEILSHHNRWVQQRCAQILESREIQLHLNCEVQSVAAHRLIGRSNLELEFDQLFWVTGAAAPLWLGATGLALSKSGFIEVDDDLRSLSHPHIFAAGDVATMVHQPRPKAGVFAVRQGKPLAENLRRVTQGEPTQPLTLQKNFLSLIGTGDENAIASWGMIPLGLESDWLWRWKDHIDRKFMAQFETLSSGMRDSDQVRSPQGDSVSPISSDQASAVPMHCAGCGSKVGGSILEAALAEIEQPVSPEVMIGLDGDDAAVVRVPPGTVMVHTVDYFRQIINDSYLFGKIATHHALSDLYAMGATPQTALAIATIPYGTPRYQRNSLSQLLTGAVEVLNQAGATLVGGHTTEGEELAFGLSCNGYADPEHLLKKNGLSDGNTLILTQALGIGVLFAAWPTVKSHWIDHALESMLQSNQAAGELAQQFGATACTDITGFGLLGHLWEMVRGSTGTVTLHLDSLPLLLGALELSQQGVRSSLYRQNSEVQSFASFQDSLTSHPHWPLLFDPQTSGGLLMALPNAQVDACLTDLAAAGYPDSCIIGQVNKGPSVIKVIS